MSENNDSRRCACGHVSARHWWVDGGSCLERACPCKQFSEVRAPRGPLIIGKGMSPATRFGYEPCPTCGGRKAKSSNSRALNGPIKCADPFHGGP